LERAIHVHLGKCAGTRRRLHRRPQASGVESLKRVHLELGGKNPVIVFE
jgi:acyl-CoA reductase-like NAD-dependent aldehyde dehydrogenase